VQLTLTRPDDWHLHLRDGPLLARVAPHSARSWGRAMVMPNLVPPITRLDMALAYRRRILAAVPEDSGFEPLMTLYLTETTDPDELRAAADHPQVQGVKLYPAGATTHSDAGVRDLARVEPALAVLEETGLPLLIHGEVTDPAVDVFDREAVFIERHLEPLLQRHPRLRVVLEHVTTEEGVRFVSQGPANLAATITPHHLRLNRNAMFQGGLRPHHYCLPVLKRERHRLALLEAATSGNPRFFAGTDSAPHPRRAKEAACGCAGIYSAHAAVEIYAEIFEQAGALDRLEGFLSLFGPAFYGLPRNRDRIRLVQQPWTVPERIDLGDDELVPLAAGETLRWQLQPVAD